MSLWRIFYEECLLLVVLIRMFRVYSWNYFTLRFINFSIGGNALLASPSDISVCSLALKISEVKIALGVENS